MCDLPRRPQGRCGKRRRGATLVLFAFLFMVFAGMAAMAVDYAWVGYARNELQVAADAGAMAGAGQVCVSAASSEDTAREYVGRNAVGGPDNTAATVQSQITVGMWDTTGRSFSAGNTGANAVKVTLTAQLPLFIARILGYSYSNLTANAVAAVSPRDIAFVVDLSGSMNNDTEIWSTAAIDKEFPQYPNIGENLVAAVFQDFGYGSYPGTLKHVAQGLTGAPNNDTSYSWLANTYLLNNSGVSTTYRVKSSDSSATRKTKAYSWIIDNQLASIMPAAQPTPSSTTNLTYWTAYLDYIIKPYNGLPPNQNSYQLSGAGNPYTDAWPSLTSSSYSGYYNKLGYLTYVQFMMDYGRDKTVNGVHPPLSTSSPLCPWKTDSDPTSASYGLQFPPREQPTHAARVAIIAAINLLAQINQGRSESLKDHVCLITFDTAAGCVVRYPLSVSGCDYQAVKNACRGMQAVADDTSSTASENGLIMARNQLDPTQNPSGARPAAKKIVIFLSDGIPNLHQSSTGQINSFMNANSKDEWFTSGTYRMDRDAVLMQVAEMQMMGWKVFPVAVGLGADLTLMDRMARTSGTATTDPNNPNGPKISSYASGNPADYQSRLISIFNSIVSQPMISLVH